MEIGVQVNLVLHVKETVRSISFMLISFDIIVNSMMDILIENIHQLNVTMQQNIDQLRDEFNKTVQNTHQLSQHYSDQLRDEFNQTMKNTCQQNIEHLRDEFNEAIQNICQVAICQEKSK